MIETEHQTQYRPAPVLTILVIAGLTIFAFLDLMYFPAGIIGMYGLGILGEGSVNQDLIDISVLIRGLSGLGQLVMFIYMAICFGMLMFRFANNARAIGFTGFSYSPGWVVGWYYVPFAHLIMPYKAIAEVWRASKAEVRPGVYPEWWDTKIGFLLKAWWAAWIFGTLLNNTASKMSRSASFETLGMTLIPFAALLQVLSAILCILVVLKLTKGQDRQAEVLFPDLTNEQGESKDI